LEAMEFTNSVLFIYTTSLIWNSTLFYNENRVKSSNYEQFSGFKQIFFKKMNFACIKIFLGV